MLRLLHRICYYLLLATGVAFSQIQYNLAPRPVLNGKMWIFFNESIDTGKALPGNLANGNENLEQRVIDAVNIAKGSVDLTAYELTSLNTVVALCKAKERGIRVRIVLDDAASKSNNEKLWQTARKLLDKYSVPWMTDAGWPWVQRKENFYKNYRAQMHDKFVVIDYVTPDSNDDFVISGSHNFTITGLLDAQNLVKVQSKVLAKMYTQEFEMMWGGSGNLPDTLHAKFHQYKGSIPTQAIKIGKGQVEPFFAPMDKDNKKPNFLQVIADLISREADHDIRICAFSFSSKIEIDEAIEEKFESKEAFDIKAVFDRGLSQGNWTLYNAMKKNPNSRKPWKKSVATAFLSNEDRKLHHKYIIIDAENPDTTDVPVVITGSFNFSSNANEVNDDNFLVLYDRQVANQYLQEFYGRYRKAQAIGNNAIEIDESDDE